MKKILFLLALILTVSAGFAQRKVTPVRNKSTVAARNERRDSINPGHLAHFHDENGNVIVVDTVTGKEIVDTVPKPGEGGIPKMIYPLLHNVSVGLDVWDPIMRIMGNHYGLVGFSASVSLHNRYIPTFEFGFGTADYTPDDGNFTYKSKLAPYFKIGCDYNIFYNSNPDYYLYAGIRYGVSFFKYQLKNVLIENEYWDITETVDMPERSFTANWIEICLGLKVKIYGPVSMGWSVRYHSIVAETAATYGKPYYVPGFGTHSSSIGGSFSIYYTLNLDKKK